MDRTENIRQMEEILDSGQLILDQLDRALDTPENTQQLQEAIAHWNAFAPRFSRLEAYYCSSQWQQDYDEITFFAPLMKCGVLSQDAVFDLLEKHDEVLKKLQEIQA